MEDEDKVGVLIEFGLEAPKTAKKERRSFYALPKTLSEDDDTFGVLTLPSNSRIDNSEAESVVDTGVLVQFDNSQSSTESFEPSKHITLDSQFSSSKQNCSTQPFTSSHISLGQSLTSTSRFNDNISKISHAATPSGFSLISDDDVFSAEKSPENRTTNWDMIMNEAQFLAMAIKEEKPLKTPAQKVLVGGLMGDFSPCESLDSPLFDINKEIPPDDMLLQLSPYQFSGKTTNKSEDKSLDNSADQSPVKNLNKDLFLNNNVLPSRDGEMEENFSEKMLLKNSICQDTPKKSVVRRPLGSNNKSKENIEPRISKPRQLVQKPSIRKLSPLLSDNNGRTKLEKVGVNSFKTRNPSPNPKIEVTESQEPKETEKYGIRASLKKSTPVLPLRPKVGSVVEPIRPSARLNSSKFNTLKLNSSKLNSSKLNPSKPNSSNLNSSKLNSSKLNSSKLNSSKLNSSNIASNTKSQVKTGASMPTMKRTLPVKGLTLNKSAGFTKPKIKVEVTGVKSVAEEKPINSCMPAPRPMLHRQGSSLARPVMSGSLQSTPSRRFGQGLSSTPSNRLPATPNSRIPPPSTAGVSSTPGSRLPAPSGLATPRRSLATPAGFGSSRFQSAAPSPMVPVGLVSSTPAIPNPRSTAFGLPSPIGVKRRGN